MAIKLRLRVCNMRIFRLGDFAEKQTSYTSQTILRKIPFFSSDFPLGITGAIDPLLGDHVPESSIKCLYWSLSSSGCRGPCKVSAESGKPRGIDVCNLKEQGPRIVMREHTF